MDNTTLNNLTWKIIDKLFIDNPNLLTNHHLDSYNNFFDKNIYRIFREKNPIKIFKEENPDTKEYCYQTELYLAGVNGDLVYFGKPVIYDDSREHYMFPNEARLRNMTYAVTIHIDVEVKYKILLQDGNKINRETKIEKIYMGRFPIMINSNLCILNQLNKTARFGFGECKNDPGGYFIIDGKEKAIISQEKFADNMMYIRDNHSELYSHSVDIKSVSEDSSKPIRTLSIRIVRPNDNYTNNNIVVNIPNVRKPVPFFILMRALGIESDKSIIEHCLLDLDKNNNYIDLFIPSIHDAGEIYNQEIAIKYIATLTKNKTVPHTLHILCDYLLPHIGETNYIDKAFYLGYMVFELLKVFKKVNKPTDRDSFCYKRVELTGDLIYSLFKEYYTLQQKHIFQKIDKEYYYKKAIYQEENFINLIENNINEIFRERILEKGFKKAFKGAWGAEEHTRRPEVIQDLNRLSYNSFISHLRKLNLPLDSSAKVVGPRLLHSSQWGIIDPVDTPDGGNVGLHKHLSIGAYITNGYSRNLIVDFLHNQLNMELLDELTIQYISLSTKIIVNGSWVGVVTDPVITIDLLKSYRRIGLIPIYTSISWNKLDNIINIYTDGGRICRPVFYVENTQPSYIKYDIDSMIKSNTWSYNQLLIGFNKFKQKININDLIKSQTVFYKPDELYTSKNLVDLLENPSIIEYIDSLETETSLIAFKPDTINKMTTHLEIHGSLLYGVMGNQIVFPENNQLPRDLFSCGQSRQGVSLYHSNYQYRIDKMGVVLNYGQIPLVKSRYLKYIYNEENTYGINAIVAIGSYNGYNVEDSILFNEGSVKRGMFNTTYFNMYESKESSEKIAGSVTNQTFVNIEQSKVIGKKPGYDYSHLDKNGLINENKQLDDKIVLIGKATTNHNNPDTMIDASVTPKKGQLGFVDKSFITDGEEGYRIAKVRIREERIPAIGDKFCSRCGQKGTMGILIPEADMPYTEDGIRPDLIINPHALPSRMTIGQLIETLMGKACGILGGFGDCTAFQNIGPKYDTFGSILSNLGYSSTGDELFYNGMTGEQLSMNLFVGPCYYMRLKHMVKDKINYRARGPRTVLTRQTVQGRANDGGLRIGEMERDGIIGHGATAFLKESMLVRGDDYYMAVCNNSGAIAIYNSEKNIFLSPFVDGPIEFTKQIDDSQNIKIISRYGRNFSIIRVPYSFKLLMQELQTMNIQMRVITEDNIDNLKSMNLENSRELYQRLELLVDVEKQEKDNLAKTIPEAQSGAIEKEKIEDDSDSGSDTGLSPVTIQSIKRAEEEAKQLQEEEDFQEAITIGETVPLSGVEDLETNNKIDTEKSNEINTNTDNTSNTEPEPEPEPELEAEAKPEVNLEVDDTSMSNDEPKSNNIKTVKIEQQ